MVKEMDSSGSPGTRLGTGLDIKEGKELRMIPRCVVHLNWVRLLRAGAKSDSDGGKLVYF